MTQSRREVLSRMGLAAGVAGAVGAAGSPASASSAVPDSVVSPGRAATTGTTWAYYIQFLDPTSTPVPGGGSRGAGHKDWIDVDQLHWSSSSTEPTYGGGGSAGKVTLGQLTFMADQTMATSRLLPFHFTGRVLPTVTLVGQSRSSEKIYDAFRAVMQVVTITGYDITGAVPGSGPGEAWTLSFGKVIFGERRWSSTTGMGPWVDYGWDRTTSTALP